MVVVSFSLYMENPFHAFSYLVFQTMAGERLQSGNCRKFGLWYWSEL